MAKKTTKPLLVKNKAGKTVEILPNDLKEWVSLGFSLVGEMGSEKSVKKTDSKPTQGEEDKDPNFSDGSEGFSDEPEFVAK